MINLSKNGDMEMNKMNKRKVWLLILGGIILLIAGAFVGGLSISGLLPWQSGNLYKDPQGRFTMKIDNDWEQVKTDGSYTEFKISDPPLHMYVLVLKANTIKDAFSQALMTTGFDAGLLSGGNAASLGDWQLYAKTDAAGLEYGLAGQIVEENAYVAMVKADKPGVGTENAAVMRALMSLKIAGKQATAIKSYAGLETMLRQQVDSLAGSVSVAVVHQNKIVYTYAYGQANPVKGIGADKQTIYMFGSMTKMFTASALMQLEEQGKVDLDAWPGKYIPEFPKNWNVTVRQLLDHSACLPDSVRLAHGLIAKAGESFPPLKEIFTAYVRDYPDLVCEPGKVSQYANTHYLALARIIEEVSGEPYDTYVVDHILTPLAMDSTRFQLTQANNRYAKGQYPADQAGKLVAEVSEYRGSDQADLILQKGESYATMSDYRILPPWGGLRGTPSDVTNFLQMYLNGGRYGDIQILKPETVAAMEKMQRSKDGSPLGLGLGWWFGKDDFGEYYYHNGSAPDSEATMRFYPKLDLGVVVMGNVTGYQSNKIAEGLVSAWMNEK
jgi:D-alanyl-D-alanine carboxypeptidase